VLIVHIILAAVAVGAIALRPEGGVAVLVVAAAAGIDALAGADAGPALDTVLPLACFLTAALSLAAMIERSGLCDRAAAVLARAGRGRCLALYALVCAVCAGLTAVVSLDGAVVLMVPLVLVLHRRFGAPFAPLFVGVVAVANPVSIAVPQGNPTNLVVMERLGLSPAVFTAHLLVPGLAAAVACALAADCAAPCAFASLSRGRLGTGSGCACSGSNCITVRSERSRREKSGAQLWPSARSEVSRMRCRSSSAARKATTAGVAFSCARRAASRNRPMPPR